MLVSNLFVFCNRKHIISINDCIILSWFSLTEILNLIVFQFSMCSIDELVWKRVLFYELRVLVLKPCRSTLKALRWLFLILRDHCIWRKTEKRSGNDASLCLGLRASTMFPKERQRFVKLYSSVYSLKVNVEQVVWLHSGTCLDRPTSLTLAQSKDWWAIVTDSRMVKSHFWFCFIKLFLSSLFIFLCGVQTQFHP